ncbi:MAG: hypothetical protein ACREDJ_08755 [Methylocella sp.]
MKKEFLIPGLFCVAGMTFAVPADAKGCIKGAIVGAIAGHFLGHHGGMGAVAGCAYGHHRATAYNREYNRAHQSMGRSVQDAGSAQRQ